MFASKTTDLSKIFADGAAHSADRAIALARRGADAVRGSSQQLHERALRASDSTVGYIKDEPVKSVLIAAVAGAMLCALASLLMQSQSRGRD
jgi:ElaB/YqjD/DUF883 family membrane-anchored ribosome-binding protein